MTVAVDELKPVAWLYGRANFRLTRNFDTRLSETPLYAHPLTTTPIDDRETPVGDHQMVEAENQRLRVALAEIERRTGLLIHQNTGRWSAKVEHDRRTVDVLTVNQSIAGQALAAGEHRKDGERQRLLQDKTSWPHSMTQDQIESSIDALCGCGGKCACSCVSVINEARRSAWQAFNERFNP